jgi:ABC-type nitrate/sulfonate/bicarbonate transport system substrate-binding protein
MINRRIRWIVFCTLLMAPAPRQPSAEAKSYIAYISDSTSSSVIYWIAKEAGLFKKHGLDLDTIFINGSVRGIQSLIAGDLGYSGAVGTAVINAKLAGADIAIIQSQMNTLPYFIIGNASIRSPEMLKGRAAAVHIPGTSADFAMRLALSKVGVSYKDIKAITVGGAPARLAAVAQSQADFTVVTDGERIQAEKMGMRVVIDMAKLNVPFQFNCSVTTRKGQLGPGGRGPVRGRGRCAGGGRCVGRRPRPGIPPAAARGRGGRRAERVRRRPGRGCE